MTMSVLMKSKVKGTYFLSNSMELLPMSKYDISSVTYLCCWAQMSGFWETPPLSDGEGGPGRESAARLGQFCVCGSTGVISCVLLLTPLPSSERKNKNRNPDQGLASGHQESGQSKPRRFALKYSHCISSPETITISHTFP